MLRHPTANPLNKRVSPKPATRSAWINYSLHSSTTMDDIADTATPEPAIVHDPPSLPASPPGKRTRFIEPLPSDPLPPPLELPATHQPLQPDEALAAAIPALSSPTSARSMTAMASVPLKVKLLSKKGKAPERGSVGAAGYDIYRYRTAQRLPGPLASNTEQRH